ncbi:MAG: alpha/beta fold hydrolase [Oscillochloris sp.]|nr:alpha/beta fold hydrolase [Oscillochloris sp.]
MNSTTLPLLPVPPTIWQWRGHNIATYRAGVGAPVVLIHSINAAASAFEMRGPFCGLQDRYAVHALDLLGYGNSDRPERRYSAEDYTALISDYLATLDAPATLIASSLGAAYAVAATDRCPDRVRGLVLAGPVGITQLAERPSPLAYAVYRILRGPVGRVVFRLLTTRAGTRYFLRTQAYYRASAIDQETHDGFYYTCQHPNAFYAPICFLTGLLNCDISAAFARLRVPILLIWGRQSQTTPASRAAEFQARNSQARLEIIDQAGLMVQDEQPAEFNRLVREFLAA